MRISKMSVAAFAAALFTAGPALAQDRTRSVAQDIARGIRDAAVAIGTVREAWDDSQYDIRWRGPERDAIRMCAPSVQRYGRMRVDQVRPYKRSSLRVYGIVEGGYGGHYDYRDRYRARSFTCTVRYDGRVKVKTRRLRR